MTEPARRYRLRYVTAAAPRQLQEMEFCEDNKELALGYAEHLCATERWTLIAVDYLGRNEAKAA